MPGAGCEALGPRAAASGGAAAGVREGCSWPWGAARVKRALMTDRVRIFTSCGRRYTTSRKNESISPSGESSSGPGGRRKSAFEEGRGVTVVEEALRDSEDGAGDTSAEASAEVGLAVAEGAAAAIASGESWFAQGGVAVAAASAGTAGRVGSVSRISAGGRSRGADEAPREGADAVEVTPADSE